MPTTLHAHPHAGSFRWLAAAAAVIALGAYAGAVGLATGWLSIGDRLNDRLPFASPVLGGLALLFVVAVPYTVLAIRAWRGASSTGATAQVVGAITVGWIVVQVAFLRELSYFHPMYVAVGVAVIVVGRRLRHRVEPEVDTAAVERFLAQRRIALVGASPDPARFSNAVSNALVQHGHDVVPVNPRHTEIAGVECVADVASAGPVDGVMVMVTGPAALAAVEQCIAHGVPRVWLFRGVGSPGALSPEAVAMCRAHSIDVVAGACPLMFLPPATGIHRAHLAVRRFSGAVS